MISSTRFRVGLGIGRATSYPSDHFVWWRYHQPSTYNK